MTLTQPPPTDSGSLAPDARHYPTVYHPHMSPMLLQGPPSQQVANYMVAAPSGGHTAVLQGQPVQISTPGPNHAFTSATPGPAGFPSPTLNQPVLQQHAFIQQPLQQVHTLFFFMGSSTWFLPAAKTSQSFCFLPDVHMLLLLSSPPTLLHPAAAAATTATPLPTVCYPAAIQLPSEPKSAPAAR